MAYSYTEKKAHQEGLQQASSNLGHTVFAGDTNRVV